MNKIIHPLTNEKISIFSKEGINLLKNYISTYNFKAGANKNNESTTLEELKKQFQEMKNEIEYNKKKIKFIIDNMKENPDHYQDVQLANLPRLEEIYNNLNKYGHTAEKKYRNISGNK